MSRSPTPLQIQRAIEREEKARQKAQGEQYRSSREYEVRRLNEQIKHQEEELRSLLLQTLPVDDYIDIASLKKSVHAPKFAPGSLATSEAAPVLDELKKPNFILGLIPGSRRRYEVAFEWARLNFEEAEAAWTKREQRRVVRLAEATAAHDKQVEAERVRVAQQHNEIEAFQSDFDAGHADAVVRYFSLIVEASNYPPGFSKQAKLAFVPESKQLVIEHDLPSQGVVPTIREYRYVRARDAVTEHARPQAEIKSIYASALSQVALRTLHELFEADRAKKLDTIVYNGYVDTIDKSSGRPVRPCLITVRATREVFGQLDLSKVDAAACLRRLSATVSSSPYDLAAVRPVLEFNMVDKRFVEETDVLSGLDQRPNLMELTPSEFESLITNLFEKMGLETRLTQASRDGGVDCVAYDSRPIFGGKVVIQAKRYKNTVGVSAVRDLFGTVQNEGASKGILVTTSGFGAASFEFASNKPLELLSGSHLLHLLAEHADIEARIEVPENWADPLPDSGETLT